MTHIRKKTTINVFEGHTHPIRQLKVSSDYEMIISCSLDGTVRLWDIHII